MSAFNFSFAQIFSAGGVILLLLVALSVYSLALMFERWTYFKRTTWGLRSFLKKIHENLSQSDLSSVLSQCKQGKSAASEIVMASLVGPNTKEDRRRSTERAIERHLAKLERGLSQLGTIGSIAPFVGLFGTVLGVMRAFRDLAGTAGAGPGVVATGIAEALITTAAGLFVAIPAIIGYNYFTNQSIRFAEELRWVTDEILERLTEK